MGTAIRIVLVIVCIVALYYLVVTLARSVAEEDASGWRQPEAAEQLAWANLEEPALIGSEGRTPGGSS